MASTPQEKPLRFKVGDLVLYRYSDGWFEGKVVSLNYRDASWEESHPSAPYQIQGLTTGHAVCAQDDSDQLVSKMPPDLTPNPRKVTSPEVLDPNQAMYVEIRDEWSDTLKQQVQEYIKLKRPKNKITTANVPHVRGGVEGHIIAQVAQVVLSRRRYQIYGYQDLTEAFDSIVPPENDLAELETKAKTELNKMLQLADSLMFGLKGWPRDPNRAFKIYHAAAYGCPEDMVEPVAEADGYPGGLPEAACAVAQSFHNHCMVTAFGNHDEGASTIVQVVKIARRNAEVMRGLRGLLKWYNHAIRKDHVCPNALRYAEVIVKLTPQHQQLLGDVEPLMTAWKYRQNEIQKEKEAKIDAPPLKRPEPWPVTITLLSFKAMEIYNSLPSNNRVSSIHLEFRQLPLNNTPIYFFAVNRGSAELIKCWRLPSKYQMQPFSIESVEEAWLHILYELHLGIPAGKQQKRCRPQQITFMNDALHHKFADYLRDKFGDDNLTKVNVVEDDDICRSLTETGNRPLRDVMVLIEKQLVQKVMETYNYDHVVEFTHSKYLNHSLTAEKSMILAAETKERGNTHFGAARYVAARYYYTDGIVLLRGLRDKKEEAYKLLGTMVSNRAACTLEIAECCHVDTAIPLLKETAIDCGLVLKCSWKKLIPDTVRAKLSYRQDIATESAKALEQNSDPSDKTKKNGTTSDDVTVEMKHLTVDNEEKAVVRGGQISNMRSAKNKGSNDVCPACLGRFRVEHADHFCTVLRCGHAYCLACVGDIQHKSLRMQNLCCPLCRTSIDNLDEILDAVLEEYPSLVESAKELPCNSEKLKQQILRQILLIHRFNMPKVSVELSCVMLPNLLSRPGRQPIQLIGRELRKAFEDYEEIHDFESDEKKAAMELVLDKVNKYQEAFQKAPGKEPQFRFFCFDLLGRNFQQSRSMYDHLIVPCLSLMTTAMVSVHPQIVKPLMEYAHQQQKPVTCQPVPEQPTMFLVHWGENHANIRKSIVDRMMDDAIESMAAYTNSAEAMEEVPILDATAGDGVAAELQPNVFGFNALN